MTNIDCTLACFSNTTYSDHSEESRKHNTEHLSTISFIAAFSNSFLHKTLATETTYRPACNTQAVGKERSQIYSRGEIYVICNQ